MGIKAIKWIKHIITEQVKTRYDGSPFLVLDLGCGKGAITREIAQIPQVMVYGIDVDQRSIRHAKSCISKESCHFFVGDLDNLTLRVQFDVIVCTDVIEHIPDTKGLIRLMFGLLKPTGILLLAVPNAFGPFELLSGFRDFIVRCIRVLKIKKFFHVIHHKMMRDISEVQSYNLESPHVHHFYLHKIKQIFSDNGFQLRSKVHLSFIIISILMNTPLGIFIKPGSRLFYRLEMIDSILVDFIPHWMSGSWLFEMKKKIRN